jgi:NAD(P)-dependent dehydrogenase (short-subunit alcohol dehydrogenase family)
MNDLIPGSAVVTGGGSGIGRAIALALAAGGAPIAVVDLFPDGGRETVALIGDKGGRATFVEADVSRWADVDRAVTAGVAQLGPLGIMVNAAGILVSSTATSRSKRWPPPSSSDWSRSTSPAPSSAPSARSPRCCRVRPGA